jgi:hypothetical protein
MKESNLSREFNKREVQRMRNLISGNVGDRTRVQSGWEKQTLDKKEGDVWEENGKTWTIKRGIKQSVTKHDSIKKLAHFPIACPKCKKHMRADDLNKKMYSIHSMCLDCVIEMEAELKKQGKFESYNLDMLKSNEKVYLQDVESALEAWYTDNETFVTENGQIESWVGGNKKVVYDAVKEQLNRIKSQQE